MQRKQLRFGNGFHVALGSRRAQAATHDARARGHGRRTAEPPSRKFVVAGTGAARVNGRRYALRAGTLLLIEHGDRHEIANTGRRPLRTLNLYVPPAYTARGDELPRAKP